MPPDDLVIILGSGASINCGLPSTAELTDCAVAAFKEAHVAHRTGFGSHLDRAESANAAAEQILDALQEAYGDAWNFETLIHAVRHMDAFASTTQGTISGAPSTYRPVSSIFADLKPVFRDSINAAFLHYAGFAIVRAIHEMVGRRMSSAEAFEFAAREKTWEFLRVCAQRFRLTVVDLNYDTVADEARIDWRDGFTLVNAAQETSLFNPVGWLDRGPREHRLIHLHGSVLFGLRLDEDRETPWEVAKYENEATALSNLKMTGSALTLIGGVDQGAYALISGLDKSGNLAYNPRPFGHYLFASIEALCNSCRVLVIGYGGRDPHLNTWLAEHASIHGDARRAAAILPYDWQWNGQHKRGENIMLRSLFGHHRWDVGQGTACGTWAMNTCRAGPMLLVSRPAPEAFEESDEILRHLEMN